MLNTMGNFHYVGKFPDAYYFGIQHMSSKDREAFLKWHSQQTDKTFDMQKELLTYTRADVSILREACTKFRDMINETTTITNSKVTGVDPFAHATIASCAMQVIRQLMLYEEHDVTLTDGREGRAVLKRGEWKFNGKVIEESMIAKSTFIKSPIPQIPVRGYGKHPNDSEKAVVWLEWLSKVSNRHIQHSRNGGEFRVPGTRYHTDGVHFESKSCYEFLGCRYHGHHCIANRDVRDPRTRQTLAALFNKTQSRIREIEQKGYTVVSIWECEFDRLLKVRPLKIRDSFFGGRVSPTKMFYECQDDERVRYMDVTSLYPFVTLSGEYPTSHPEIIADPDKIDHTLQSYYGVAKVKILPPRGLYIPVLPVRCNGRLKFPLCQTCSVKETEKKCQCSDVERAIIGVWTTPEILEAVRQGYKIVHVYEVYNYKETTATNNHGGIFEEYVKMFLQQKQQASGYPNWVNTEQDKDAFIKFYKEHQGIELDREKIQHNPSLRLVCKLFLHGASLCKDLT